MIPPIKKIPAFLLAVILSLSLCNMPTVFATGSISIPVFSLQGNKEAVVDTLSTAEPPTPSTVQPPEGDGTEKGPDDIVTPANSTTPEEDMVWREAATIDELASLLEDEDWINAGGRIRVTADLEIPAEDYCTIWPGTSEDKPLVVDLGTHTLYVEGWLRSFGNIKYMGHGGENGLIRIRTGGKANIHSAVFAVTEEGGYAIWQENDSTLSYEPVKGSVGDIHFAQTLEGEASTFEELMLLLEDQYWKANGGEITVTDDLLVPVGEEYKIGWLHSKALTTLDMGPHTLFVEGTLGVYDKIKIIGDGGENGLIRIRAGGDASIWPAALIAEEGGYAIWQEECSLLEYESNENLVGKVHFAERPVAVPFSVISPDTALPVAVVHDGQTLEEVLPMTDSVKLYWQGTMDQGNQDTDKLIPVTWDLEPYQEQLDRRERVLITGSYPEAVAFQTPVCLVVFQNGNPATFLNGYGLEASGQPVASIHIELAEPELGCRFEWSQDGSTWLPAEFKTIPSDDTLCFMVNFPQEEPPTYPYYLSAVVDYPDGSVGYSDVIAFIEADRECSYGGNRGGNRGGGTDITDPPEVLNPDETDNFGTGDGTGDGTGGGTSGGTGGGTGQKPENSGSDEAQSPEPDSAPDAKPELPTKPDITQIPIPEPSDQADTTPPPTITPMEEIFVIGQADPPAKVEPDLPVSQQILSEGEGEASKAKPDEPADTEASIPKPADSVPPSSTEETLIAETKKPQSDDGENNPLVKAGPIAIGGTATAVVIGMAGVYHSESLRRRLWAALKKLIRIKK